VGKNTAGIVRNVNFITPATDLSFCPSSALRKQLHSLLCACLRALKMNRNPASIAGLISFPFLSERPCSISKLSIFLELKRYQSRQTYQEEANIPCITQQSVCADVRGRNRVYVMVFAAVIAGAPYARFDLEYSRLDLIQINP
jgi:hypothetical protein